MADKFTKGPYKVLPQEADVPYIRIRGTQLGRRYKIANVHAPIDDQNPWEAEESLANAKLFGAATDLLASSRAALTLCERIADQYKGIKYGADFHALGKSLRAAISKATGE